MSTDIVQRQLNAVTAQAKNGWQGFRSVLLNAAHILGTEIRAGHLTYFKARTRLISAIITANEYPNEDDLRWIDQGLHDATKSTREDLGRLARDVWAEGADFVNWEDLDPGVKERLMDIGTALYNTGFEAGADSVKVL